MSPKGLSVIILAIVALIAALLPSMTGYPINPVEKAYVSSTNPNTNYAGELKVAGWVEQRRAWIKFDFSGFPSDATITSATFKFYASYIESHLGWNFIVGLFFASNEWSQTTLTWNNQPSIEATSWADFNLGYIEGEMKVGWHEVTSDTLKNRIQTALKTDKKLTVVMQVKYARTGETFYATFTTAYIDVEYTTPTPPPPKPPAPTYNLMLKVKDQVGNPLPAYVKADGVGVSCDKHGEATLSFGELKTVTVTATVNVGKQSFNSTVTVTLTKDGVTKEIVITRRFFWKFYINYTDGSLPFGKITASSPKETINVSITLGRGEAYLLDTTYTLTFEESPAVSIDFISVRNDGVYYATINPETGKSQTTSVESPEVSTPTPAFITIPEEIRALLPQLIFITLILLITVIVISVIRGRRR